eukprot:CAMPEP_0201572796 /NCGR_PEP_ID=MMETSP0190_2-20130828/16254_1 /ASSEMBLY_ACC=CAM_ASM_000263 /TAXON_ID=37353 /ORGANISM="Rosalina sp." /LENGTH=134 /DNA_ID=CAMNT_0047998989 /DNA_START=272 /DNA_END=676 /DNA_ORIENTATION=+
MTTSHLMYSVKIPSAIAGCEDWGVLCIDYMAKYHANYEIKSVASNSYGDTGAWTHQTLYFIPRVVPQIQQIQPVIQQQQQQPVVIMQNSGQQQANEGGGMSAMHQMEAKQPEAPPQYNPGVGYPQVTPKQETWQ